MRSPRLPCTLRISTGSSPVGPNQCGIRVSLVALQGTKLALTFAWNDDLPRVQVQCERNGTVSGTGNTVSGKSQCPGVS